MQVHGVHVFSSSTTLDIGIHLKPGLIILLHVRE